MLKDTQQVNPILDSLDPQTFEVTAKKHSALWNTDQYKGADFRGDLMQTTDRIAQSNLNALSGDMVESLRETKHNNRTTNISEYSNALNRGRVFTNPKFSSC